MAKLAEYRLALTDQDIGQVAAVLDHLETVEGIDCAELDLSGRDWPQDLDFPVFVSPVGLSRKMKLVIDSRLWEAYSLPCDRESLGHVEVVLCPDSGE